jgi:hypothetical protein
LFRAELVKRLANDAVMGVDRAMKGMPIQAFVHPELDETSSTPVVRVSVRSAMQDRWIDLTFTPGTPAGMIHDAVTRAYKGSLYPRG